MAAYMRNTLNGRIYVYDEKVFKKRPHLELICGDFLDGEFVPEALIPGERSQIPETPIAADESVADPDEEMSQLPAEVQRDNGLTPKALKSKLESRGISQRQFAERLGCSQSYLSKVLKGLKPMPARMATESKRLLASWDQ